ncbi:LmeA family phospholipid-binding protein [Candidatus Riflebacteria bacterium]
MKKLQPKILIILQCTWLFCLPAWSQVPIKQKSPLATGSSRVVNLSKDNSLKVMNTINTKSPESVSSVQAKKSSIATDTEEARNLEIQNKKELIKQKLITALQKKLHSPKSLKITISQTDDNSFIQGKFQRLEVEVEDALIEHLNIKKANFIFNDLQLVLEKLINNEVFEIPRIDAVGIDAIITETDLNAMVKKKVKEVQSPRISIKNNKMILSGKARLGGIIPLKFRAAGHFELKNKSEIHFISRSLKISGLPVPFASRAIRRINPILRIDKFPFTINLKGIGLYPGIIHFYSDEEFKEAKELKFQTKSDADKKRKHHKKHKIYKFGRDHNSYLDQIRRDRRP